MAAADHLQVPRQHGLFNHHGIDLGDGTVAHYLEGREILRSSTDDFSQGQPLTVIAHADASPTRVTLQRAMSRIGEQNYNLLFLLFVSLFGRKVYYIILLQKLYAASYC